MVSIGESSSTSNNGHYTSRGPRFFKTQQSGTGYVRPVTTPQMPAQSSFLRPGPPKGWVFRPSFGPPPSQTQQQMSDFEWRIGSRPLVPRGDNFSLFEPKAGDQLNSLYQQLHQGWLAKPEQEEPCEPLSLSQVLSRGLINADKSSIDKAIASVTPDWVTACLSTEPAKSFVGQTIRVEPSKCSDLNGNNVSVTAGSRKHHVQVLSANDLFSKRATRLSVLRKSPEPIIPLSFKVSVPTVPLTPAPSNYASVSLCLEGLFIYTNVGNFLTRLSKFKRLHGMSYCRLLELELQHCISEQIRLSKRANRITADIKSRKMTRAKANKSTAQEIEALRNSLLAWQWSEKQRLSLLQWNFEKGLWNCDCCCDGKLLPIQ